MLYIFALMTALQWEIEVKDTGEMIPAVPLAESCSALRGLAEHVRGLVASVALGSLHRCLCWLSWSRTEEINELAKMLSLCLVHVRESSPSWTCCPWAWEFERPLASSSQPRETVGESGRFPETTSCKRRLEAAFSYAIPSQAVGFGLGFYLDQGLNSLSGFTWTGPVRGAGAARLICCRPSRALAMPTRLSNSFCSKSSHLCCDWLQKSN